MTSVTTLSIVCRTVDCSDDEEEEEGCNYVYAVVGPNKAEMVNSSKGYCFIDPSTSATVKTNGSAGDMDDSIPSCERYVF